MAGSIQVKKGLYDIVQREVKGTGVPEEIVLGIIAQESMMNSPKWQYRYEPHLAKREWPKSVFSYTADPERVFSSYGAMQLVYCFMVTDHGFTNYPEVLYVPEINIPIGIQHFRQKLRLAKGDLNLALTLYNGSPRNPAARAYPGKVRARIALLQLPSE